MTPRIRSADASEMSAVLDLWREAHAEPTHTDDADSLTRLMTFNPEALIVAAEDGAVVGSVIAAWDGWRGSIYRLAVAPRYRRRGLGEHLVRTAEDRLTRKGAVRLQAIVVESD